MKAARLIAIVVAVVLLPPVLALGALILAVQSEQGERWFESQVSSRIHRDVQLEGIRVHLGWPPSVSLARLRIANPDWAKTKDLVDVTDLSATVEVPPLFSRHIVMPYVWARMGEAGLEQSGERATWRLDAEQKQPSRIELQRVVLNDGHVVYRNEDEDTALDIDVKGSLGNEGELHATAKGKFRGEAAQGTAALPGLQANPTQPIRFSGKATVGKTAMDADGQIGPHLESFDFKFHLAGHTLKDLHKVFGLVLPETPQYKLAGRLRHDGNQWVFDPFQGTVGDSDLRGSVTYRTGAPRPMFLANLHSKVLDFKDLGPVVGTPRAQEHSKTPREAAEAEAMKASEHVLPRQRFSTERWNAMDADVRFVAEKVLRPKQLPLDTLSTHIVMKDAVLRLDPLNFGMAQGRITSVVAIDPHVAPPAAQVKADIQGLDLGELFPTLKSMQQSFGTLYGRAELKGRGASVGDMLGTSDGKIVVAAEGGRISALLSYLLEIDLARAAMLLGTRNQQVDLRCAVGQLAVKNGVASPESFVIDTTDTYVKVDGKLDFANERFDVETKAKGKKPSPLMLHTSIVMEGPLKKPKIHPKAGPLVAQAGAAVALGSVLPPLAIVPYLDPGTGKDADCSKLLAEAKSEGARNKLAAASSPARR